MNTHNQATDKARAAVRAIRCGKQWGLDAALRYVEKHDAINHYFQAMLFESQRRGKRNG